MKRKRLQVVINIFQTERTNSARDDLKSRIKTSFERNRKIADNGNSVKVYDKQDTASRWS